MPITYTSRKGLTYTLYKGKTKTGKPRYYFGRTDQSQGQGEPVAELPPGYIISESVNGIVSLVKDRPSPILPEEVTAVEETLKKHPEARRYRIAVKRNIIEIYEQVGPSYDTFPDMLHIPEQARRPDLIEDLRELETRHAQYAPVMRFTLLDSKQRQFGAKRWCHRGSVDGWLELMEPGLRPIAELAPKLIPTLGTDDFFELW